MRVPPPRANLDFSSQFGRYYGLFRAAWVFVRILKWVLAFDVATSELDATRRCGLQLLEAERGCGRPVHAGCSEPGVASFGSCKIALCALQRVRNRGGICLHTVRDSHRHARPQQYPPCLLRLRSLEKVIVVYSCCLGLNVPWV